MQILKANEMPGRRPMAEYICITTADRTRHWEWLHRKRSIPAPENIEMNFHSQRSVQLRYAHLHGALGRKERARQQQPTTREKVPNSFQDLTEKIIYLRSFTPGGGRAIKCGMKNAECRTNCNRPRLGEASLPGAILRSPLTGF